jgi:hypothetical protein
MFALEPVGVCTRSGQTPGKHRSYKYYGKAYELSVNAEHMYMSFHEYIRLACFAPVSIQLNWSGKRNYSSAELQK